MIVYQTQMINRPKKSTSNSVPPSQTYFGTIINSKNNKSLKNFSKRIQEIVVFLHTKFKNIFEHIKAFFLKPKKPSNFPSLPLQEEKQEVVTQTKNDDLSTSKNNTPINCKKTTSPIKGRISDVDFNTASNLESAKKMFFHRVQPKETEAQRVENALHLGSDLLSTLYSGIKRKYPKLNESIFRDVKEITDELNNLAYSLGKAKTFNQLNNKNQDRIINLITATLQHQEPLISQFGEEMAQAIGLSQATINNLRTA